MVSLEQALAQHLTHIWFLQHVFPGFLSNTFPYWQLLSALSTLLSFSQASPNGCPCNLLCLSPSDLEQSFFFFLILRCYGLKCVPSLQVNMLKC